MTKRIGSSVSGRKVKSVQTTCEILETLHAIDGGRISELAAKTGYSKATVHSHLATLRENEFVVKRGNTYNISLKFVDFATYAKKDVSIYEIAREEVERLAEETNEVANFMVEEHGRGVFLHKSRGKDAIQTASYAGNRKELHCTALGKAILSQFPDERVEAILDAKGMPEYTENTITDKEELFEELETIREENVAFDDEEILPGLRCVAAPIHVQDKEIHSAISISGPTSRFRGKRFRNELVETVQSAANIIEVNAMQV